MSANEIPNKIHAMAVLDLSDVSAAAMLVKGVGIASVARTSAGVFTVTLLEQVELLGAVVHITHAAATSRIVVAQLQALSGGTDNIQINGFTDAGVAADTGAAYLTVLRFPTV
jgi:hypothetical protein